MASLPLIFARPNWFTSHFIARRLGVSLRTVQYWCSNGFLTRRGCIVIGTTGGATNLKGSRYWVYCPNLSSDAILRRLPIDSLSATTIPSKS